MSHTFYRLIFVLGWADVIKVKDDSDDVEYLIALLFLAEMHPKSLDIAKVQKIYSTELAVKRNYVYLPKARDVSFSFLRNFYEKNRNELLELFFANYSKVGDYCIYCGKSAPEEVEHFYPKDPLPQLAITKSNLLWACGTCNSKKSDSCPIRDVRLFHPAFDILFKRHGVLFDVVCREILLDDVGMPTFILNVVPKASISGWQRKAISRVLERFDIRNRVIDRVSKRVEKLTRKYLIDLTNSKIESLSKEFYENSNDALAEGAFDDYFAYKILRSKRKLKEVVKLIG